MSPNYKSSSLWILTGFAIFFPARCLVPFHTASVGSFATCHWCAQVIYGFLSRILCYKFFFFFFFLAEKKRKKTKLRVEVIQSGEHFPLSLDAGDGSFTYSRHDITWWISNGIKFIFISFIHSWQCEHCVRGTKYYHRGCLSLSVAMHSGTSEWKEIIRARETAGQAKDNGKFVMKDDANIKGVINWQIEEKNTAKMEKKKKRERLVSNGWRRREQFSIFLHWRCWRFCSFASCQCEQTFQPER